MKRFVSATAVTVLLAGIAASSAFGFAANFDYVGHVKGNSAAFVGFFVKHTASDQRKVTGFGVSQIPYTCSDAPSGATAGWRFDPKMRVKSDRTFVGFGDWAGLPLDPTGSVSGKLRRGGVAVGDFRLHGELAGPGTHCRTGLLDWRATKQ
jgi:hypothetical protein